MRFSGMVWAAAGVLFAFGCAGPFSLGPEDAPKKSYGLLGVVGGSVTASSERPYFEALHAIDTGMSSAWGPAATDVDPTLEIDLGALAWIDGVSIKESQAGVKVEVAAWNGGAWEVIASGLAPTAGLVSSFALPPRNTSRVRLRFSEVASSDLLVCDVAFSTTSSSPTPVPFASSSPLGEDCGCKVTGGGFIFNGAGQRVNFGLVAMTGKNGAQGHLNVWDTGSKQHFKGRVTAVTCGPETVTFQGLQQGSNIPFTGVVTDHGEPGSEDVFSFETSGYAVSGDLGGVSSGGGNLQLHLNGCEEDS